MGKDGSWISCHHFLDVFQPFVAVVFALVVASDVDVVVLNRKEVPQSTEHIHPFLVLSVSSASFLSSECKFRSSFKTVLLV